MERTYKEYIQNPMGSKNYVVSHKDMYRKMYSEKWDAIKLRENGKITYTQMMTKTDFFVYIKIPSEVVPKFYYDVVVRFFPPKGNNVVSMEPNLNNYCVQFFSNDPSFVFTFAHAFKKNDLFIDDLAPRMNKESLKSVAKERNPQDQIGYVKSLYFAYLELEALGLFKKGSYSPSTMKYDKKKLLSFIMDANEKIADRQQQGQKLAQKERREKARHKHQQSNTASNSRKSNIGNDSKIIKPSTHSAQGPHGSVRSKITGKSKITGRPKIGKK